MEAMPIKKFYAFKWVILLVLIVCYVVCEGESQIYMNPSNKIVAWTVCYYSQGNYAL